MGTVWVSFSIRGAWLHIINRTMSTVFLFFGWVYPSQVKPMQLHCSGSNLLPLTFILNYIYSGEAVRQHQLSFIPVAEAFCFHSRAVEFYKSDFANLVFFGTLYTRPAAKSKISARASTREVFK